MRSQFNILNITLLLIGASTAFTASSTNGNIQDLIKYVPLLIFGIVVLIGYHFQRTMALQGYKKYLESKLNSILGENLIFYAHIGLRKMMWSNGFSIMNMILYPFTYIISCVLALEYAATYSNWQVPVYFGCGIIYTVIFVPVFFEIKSVEKLSHFLNNKKPTLMETDQLDEMIDVFKKLKFWRKSQDCIKDATSKIDDLPYFK